ncbi:SID1 transmembrane family member 1 [Anabrus simplex]|uniref:SID1 transmembrane family member 1 n=1 Tax=Anabrus simplex TaxID=316456 RepID=UPI0035A2D4D1
MLQNHLFSFFVYVALISVSSQDSWIRRREEEGILHPIVEPGIFNEVNYFDVNDTVEYIFEYPGGDKGRPARVQVECVDSNRSFPVLVVVRQQKGVLSWQLPLVVESKGVMYQYERTSRTLCPDNNYYLTQSKELRVTSQDVIVSISTASPHNLTVQLTVVLVEDFIVSLSENRTVNITPTEPSYYAFEFPPEGPDTVLLRVDSPDKLCMTVSIQNISCPVFDLERNVQFEGYWQTVSTKGGITLRRDVFPSGFYVVFVLKGDDYDCSGTYEPPTKRERRKEITFSINGGITYQDYIIATVGTLALFTVFYIFSFVMMVIYYIRRRRLLSEQSFFDDESCNTPSSSVPPTSYGQIQSPASDLSSIPHCHSDSSLDETDIDMLRDADSDKDIFRTKTMLFVCDLARKQPRILRKKSQLYLWNLLTVAVFYSLPVVQLVITYQLVLNQTGNQDLCYYNFLCAHPLGLLSDFNHVFSNIGYVLLGLLFICLTYRRDVMHRQAGIRQDKFYGIPQHYGLFYALGVALMMEGILSACYHVCPNHSNFQFDTSFMYVIAMLCMLKIYQTRHPDINANAYATFGVLALVILVGMVGVLSGNIYFWVGFTCVHLLTCILLSAQIYYMGRWKFDLGMFKRVFLVMYHDFRASPLHCLRPAYPNRMVLLILGNVCNWALAVVGFLYHLKDFATYLLSIFMANLLLYCMFYIVMKLCYRERILPQPLIYIILSFASWAAALYFFFNKSISWALTPAMSKNYNQPCEISFYDKHDIWHFLSAASMFFSFMVLLTLDDDLTYVHRSKIPVF